MASKPPLRSPHLEEAFGLEHIKLPEGGSLTAPRSSEPIGDRMDPLRPDAPQIVLERVVADDCYIPPVSQAQ